MSEIERKHTVFDFQISVLGLSTRNLAIDGNCLFRVASYAAYNAESRHCGLCALIARYMRLKELDL